MRIFSLLITLVVLLAIVSVAFSFTALNDQNVVLDYYFGSRAMPLPVVVLLAITFGALLGVIASLGMVLKSKHRNLQLRRALKKSEREVTNLRSVPAKRT